MGEPVLRENELVNVRDHALVDYPREACGFVMRDGADESMVMRCRNIMDDLHRRSPGKYPRGAEEAFAVAPDDMAELLRFLGRGWRLHAIYHSHTRGGPHFSEDDLRWSLHGRETPSFPEAFQIVVALPGKLLTAAHAYRWDGPRKAYLLAGVLSWERRLDPGKGAILVTRQPRVMPLVAFGAPAPA